MKKELRPGFSLFLLGLSMLQTFAQPKSTPPKTASQPASFAVRAGFNQLYGDLKDPLSTPFAGASLLVPITKTVAVELPFDVGTLQSQQDDYYHSSAKTRFIQVAGAVSVDILEWFKQGQKLVELRPYGGAGLVFFRAEAIDLTTGTVQRVTNNAGSHRSRDGIEARGKAGVKRTHELVWLVGLRGATALSRRMSIFGDVRLNLVRTDKLDATLDDNNQVMQTTGPAFTEGNHYGKNSPDKWGFVTVGLNFYFGERFSKN
ncbi:hypothetical protein [Larkinella punicea]|uniref:Outer membrane protein beta-barrel domain-containing protein n=1 Tax=Larkinella punicea TaxID=2315727 RepID=A0A368JI09_9BACT|nr:hypothetical protein [Larkinella punicea]RCR66314.1 hypothetical protein DUE52_27640 [Larkinella punicea]